MFGEYYREGVLGVVYRRNNEKIEYLLLHRIKDWEGWEFVKGGLLNGEKEEEALERELFEETRLKSQSIKRIPNLKVKYKFLLQYRRDSNRNPKCRGQELQVYLVEVGNDPVIVDFIEHDDFVWVRYEEARKLLRHSNHLWTLKQANNYLKTRVDL